MPKIDIPAGNPAKPGRYVTVPPEDLFGMRHPGVRLNTEEYKDGTFFLDKERADTVEAALKGYEEASRRVLQPRQDAKALSDVARNGRVKGLEPIAS